MGIIRGMVATVLLLGLAPGARAQDGSEGAAVRTPAGAQRFLANAAEQGVLMVHVGREVDGQPRSYTVNVTWIPDGDCATRVELRTHGSDDGGVTIVARDHDWIAAHAARLGLPPPPGRFEWRHLTELSRSSVACDGCGPGTEAKAIRVGSRHPGLYFWFSDAVVAARAEFAMKFLAERCGLPDTEGF